MPAKSRKSPSGKSTLEKKSSGSSVMKSASKRSVKSITKKKLTPLKSKGKKTQQKKRIDAASLKNAKRTIKAVKIKKALSVARKAKTTERSIGSKPKSAVRKKLILKTAVKKKSLKTLKKTVAKSPATVNLRLKQSALSKIRHLDLNITKPFKYDAKLKIQFDNIIKFRLAPQGINLTFEPKDGDFLLLHTTPGFTSGDIPRAQFSALVLLCNSGTKSADLDKVVFEYKQNGSSISKDVYLPSDQLVIDPGYCWYWQNSRPYHKPGDVVFIDSPFPDKITMSFYFKNYAAPLVVTKSVKAYTQGLSLPFKASDLRSDEYVTGYSMHGGGDQVFAYDLGVQGYDKNSWSDNLPGKNGSENNHSRIWGKPIYAMADGYVLHFESNIPNNWKPDGSDEGMKKQKDELWGAFDFGGSGNHFYIRHGNVVALYAHMQNGSLNSSLMQKGKPVKKGDFLGLAGNSGNSSGPHTHIHIKTYASDDKPEDGFFRPLVFNNGFVIGQSDYPKPKSNVNWSKLNNQGIPGLEGRGCFVWPSGTHPYCEYPTNWGEVARYGVPNEKFQEEFDKVWPCGYYPVWIDGYEVGNKTYFNLIYRPSAGVQWYSRAGMNGDEYQNEFTGQSNAGMRLVNVNSYISGGKIRYSAIWNNASGPDQFAYHGKTLQWHESNFNSNADAGWVPVNVSCVDVAGQTFVTALWEKKNTGGFYLKPAMSLQDFQNNFNQFTNTEKFKLVYLDAYLKNGKPLLSGIWYRNAPDYNSWWEKTHLSVNYFQTEYNNMLNSGYLTRCIAGYNDGGEARFEGIWSK